MGDVNHISTIVKLLEKPRKKALEKPHVVSEARAQFPQFRNSSSQKFIVLSFWGNLGKTVFDYYKPDDCLIIEGYTLVKTQSNSNPPLQYLEIIVLKVYPFLLILA